VQLHRLPQPVDHPLTPLLLLLLLLRVLLPFRAACDCAQGHYLQQHQQQQ
jgi:hypothetical protein